MILFFQSSAKSVLAVEAQQAFSPEDTQKLVWLFSEATPLPSETLEGWFVGPRREMITPWSTNAVEITQNMGLTGISRIEEYFPVASGEAEHDPMLQRIYNGLDQAIFTISKQPDPIVYIEDLEAYNLQEGLALSQEEIAYLNGWIGREQLLALYESMKKNEYGQYLKDVLDGKYQEHLY